MNNCTICGSHCEDKFCPVCQYHIDTGDRSDIRQRVRYHDNRGYALIKKICEFYKIEDGDFFEEGKRQPAARARCLYSFIAVRNLHFSQKKVADFLSVSPSFVSQCLKAWMIKLKKESVRNKYLEFINY
jgi:hypothetical protein